MSRTAKTDPAEADWAPHHDRRTETRHDAKRLGTVTARLIGGSEVRLVNFSNRGILVESDTPAAHRRAGQRPDHDQGRLGRVTGRVVRSRVKGLVNGVLLYDAGINLDSELSLATAEALESVAEPAPVETEPVADEKPVETWSESDADAIDESTPIAARQSMDDEAMVQLFASVPQDLAELRRLAADNQW